MNKLSAENLQELVVADIITTQQATDIEAYYQQKQNMHAANRLNIIFAILGALLVSLAILLFIAHNWDSFNKLTKSILGFLPLVIGQALCAYTLFTKKGNTAWQEAGAIILFFAVAATTSLISQVYHIDGTLRGFLAAWLILSFPLVYIMRSFAVVILSLSVATWYATEAGYFSYGSSEIPWLYLLVLLLLAPKYYICNRQNNRSNIVQIFDWFLFASAVICLDTFTGKNTPDERIVLTGYVALLTLFYQAGKLKQTGSKNVFTNPFRRLSVLGILILLMVWSFDTMWSDLSYTRLPAGFFSVYLCLTILFLVACVALFIKQALKNAGDTDPVELSLYIFISAFFIGNASVVASTLMLNIWLLVIALWYIRTGNRQEHFGLLNFGLIIIAALAVVRFFDEEIPFVWRGFFFLVTGVGFFAANYQLVQKKKKLNHEI